MEIRWCPSMVTISPSPKTKDGPIRHSVRGGHAQIVYLLSVKPKFLQSETALLDVSTNTLILLSILVMMRKLINVKWFSIIMCIVHKSKLSCILYILIIFCLVFKVNKFLNFNFEFQIFLILFFSSRFSISYFKFENRSKLICFSAYAVKVESCKISALVLIIFITPLIFVPSFRIKNNKILYNTSSKKKLARSLTA